MERERKEQNVEIGNRLHDARENLGYTQAQFAEMLAVSDEHYRKIESGISGLTIDKMKILYQKVSIDPTYLIVGESKSDFELEQYIANCTREQRNKFIKRVLSYMEKMLVK